MSLINRINLNIFFFSMYFIFVDESLFFSSLYFFFRLRMRFSLILNVKLLPISPFYMYPIFPLYRQQFFLMMSCLLITGTIANLH